MRPPRNPGIQDSSPAELACGRPPHLGRRSYEPHSRLTRFESVITGAFDIALYDYGVQAPSAPIVVSVEDTGTVELQLFLTPSA